MERIPVSALMYLSKLKELKLNGNCLKELPAEFGNLSNLEKLEIQNNQLMVKNFKRIFL